MDYIDRVKKVNVLAKSLKDKGLASSMDDAVKMAEKMVGDSGFNNPSKDSPVVSQINCSCNVDVKNNTSKIVAECKAANPTVEVRVVKKGCFFDKMNEKYANKEGCNDLSLKPRTFFERMKEKFKKQDEDVTSEIVVNVSNSKKCDDDFDFEVFKPITDEVCDDCFDDGVVSEKDKK